jgi:hypothetical protein
MDDRDELAAWICLFSVLHKSSPMPSVLDGLLATPLQRAILLLLYFFRVAKKKLLRIMPIVTYTELAAFRNLERRFL